MFSSAKTTFYTLFSKQSRYVAYVESFNLSGIAVFIRCASKSFRLNLTSSGFIGTSVYLVLLYTMLKTCITSRFIAHCYGNSIYLRVPLFVYVLMVRMGTQTYSKNKYSGWTDAIVASETNPFDALLSLRVYFESKESFSIFSDTPLSILVSDRKRQEDFRALLDSRLDSLVNSKPSRSEKELFDGVIDHFSSFGNVILGSSFKEFCGLYPTPTSSFLGIHRFRNTEHDYVFHTSQSSFSALSSDTANLLCALLRIYNPKYLDFDGNILPITYLPGDAVISVENIPIRECWLMLMSSDISLPPTSVERTTGIKLVRDTKGAAVIDDVDSESLESVSGILLPTDRNGFLLVRMTHFDVLPCTIIYNLTDDQLLSYG